MALGSESITQINFMHWLRHHYPEVYEDTIHIANERSCSIQQGRLLKRMGVKRGVSDLFIAVPCGEHAGLWLELKEGTGKPSKEQKQFLARMIERGYAAACVTGLPAAKSIVESYLQEKYASTPTI